MATDPEDILPPQPPRLRKGDRANFKTLRRAEAHGRLALVSAIRKADGKAVALVCAISDLENGDLRPVPLAVMVEGNPFEDFHDPTACGPIEKPEPEQKIVMDMEKSQIRITRKGKKRGKH